MRRQSRLPVLFLAPALVAACSDTPVAVGDERANGSGLQHLLLSRLSAMGD